MACFIPVKPPAWKIKQCHYCKPDDVYDPKRITKIEWPEEKWRLSIGNFCAVKTTCKKDNDQ